MSRAAGRNQASGYPSDSSVLCEPCRWVTVGTGPAYGGGVSEKVGLLSRPAVPPGGFAQCRVGSTVSGCGRKCPSEVINPLIHRTRTGRPTLASIVGHGVWSVEESVAEP